MKIYTGTDIIEINRIQKVIEDLGEKFLNRIYTSKEIEYCNSKNNVKYQHYAARFAAKEAIYKALSTIIKNDITLKNFEIINLENGKPIINFVDIEIKNIENIDISISHCKNYATAVVIVLMK